MDSEQARKILENANNLHMFNKVLGAATLGVATPIANTVAVVGVVKRLASYYDIKGTAVSGGRFGIYSGRNMNDGQQRYY